MEWHRPQRVATLEVTHLRWVERLWRGARRGLLVSGGLLVVGNIALILMPAPHLHLCLFPLAFVLGPVVAAFGIKDRVLIEPTTLPCPRCQQPVVIADKLGGWPARVNCEACAAMVELNEATSPDSGGRHE